MGTEVRASTVYVLISSARGAGGRATRAVRLLLLLLLSLAVVAYLFNAAQSFNKIGNKLAACFNVAGRINDRDLYNTRAMDEVNEENIFFQEKMTQEVTGRPRRRQWRSGRRRPLCNLTQESKSLGPVTIDKISVPVLKTRAKLDALKTKFPELHKGGRYSPSNCTAVHKVAIIVPFRNRFNHLPIFLNHMHSFLMKQQIEYGIFVVDQEGQKLFNRAKLFNVGFVEAQRLKAGGWQCFIFHDIDLLPMDTRNLYTCPRQPRHMSASIDYQHFRLPYYTIFGGVSAMTLEQFKKVNGFSNKYWGWGGEDDDMFYRLRKEGYNIERYNLSIARYASLPHTKSSPNPNRYKLLSKINPEHDGLSTLEYRVVYVVQHTLYTHIHVNIDTTKSHKPPLKNGLLRHLIDRLLFL